MARLLLCVVAAFCASGAGALRIGVALPATKLRAVAAMQLAPAPTKTRTFQTTDGGGGGKGGAGPAAVVAKPKRKANTEETPMWKVILLGDEDYEEEPVRPICQLARRKPAATSLRLPVYTCASTPRMPPGACRCARLLCE
jgi:hypothetical protein